MHNVYIRKKQGEGTRVRIDGKEVEGLKSITFKECVKEPSIVILEFYVKDADIKIEQGDTTEIFKDGELIAKYTEKENE